MLAIKVLEQANVKVYKNVRETGRQLGVGSFGSVVELKIKGEGGKFAGKKIHEVLVVDGDVTLLVKECKLMSELIHPNITKFFGVCKLPRSTIPALVMELMDHSLEEVIENTTATFQLTLMTTLSIFIDIANGLAYLHGRTPQVLHRDLTARNVLLDKSMRAKITDFGNSRFVDPAMVSKTKTQTPGTQLYMPPEALTAHSKYSDRLDIFSFGHLALYTLIQEFPKDLLPATHLTSEECLAARSEVERRIHYMEKLNTILSVPDHNLFRLIKQCLHNNSTRRPSSIELLLWLQEIQGMERGEFEDAYLVEGSTADTADTKVATFLYQMERDINRRSLVEKDYESPGQFKKTGLIEKKSGGMTKKWRAYLFTLDYQKRTFQYTRVGPFAKSPTIGLDDITEVKKMKSHGERFPFQIYFNGRNSPWELNVYSEADRKDWIMALIQLPEKMQKNVCYSQLTPKGGIDIMKEERCTDVTAMQHDVPLAADVEDLYEAAADVEELYEELSGLQVPLPPIISEKPMNIPSNTHGTIFHSSEELQIGVKQNFMPPVPVEHPYEEVPDIESQVRPDLRSSYKPMNMPHYTNIHLTPKNSKDEDHVDIGVMQKYMLPLAPEEDNSEQECIYEETVAMADSVPPLAADVYDYLPSPTDSDESDGAVYEKIIGALENLHPSQIDALTHKLQERQTPSADNLPPSLPLDNSPQPHQVKNPSTPKLAMLPLEKHSLLPLSETKDIPKGEEETEELYSCLQPGISKGEFDEEKLLVTGGGNKVNRRPEWAVAQQAHSILEVLRKKALSISLSSLSCITQIEEGMFGEVYRADMKDPSVTVAIKVMKQYTSDKAMKDFQNEMNIMSQVSHTNIVRLYGIISEGRFSPALVMEFSHHGNLKTYLIGTKQPNEFLLKCMSDVAMGMHYLCERGLIHRDLAARNVLVDENKTCKVSDFGLLREVPKDNSIYISESTGPSPVRWMAPESIIEKIFSPATDVWSYGILQWEMFFPDRIPYYDMETTQMALKVSSGYRMPIPRGCPRLAGQIMRACWQQDPRDRPSFLLISNLLTSLHAKK